MASEWPYEVMIYNRVVRARVEKGLHHRNLSDDWADVQHIELTAKDAEGARRKVAARYPESQGYEIIELKSRVADSLVGRNVKIFRRPVTPPAPGRAGARRGWRPPALARGPTPAFSELKRTNRPSLDLPILTGRAD